jgi:CrcB protein
MGMLAAWFAFRGEATTAPERLFLTTGILGGFTTFSAFALDATLMWERHDVGAALLYIGASVALSIAGLIGGMFLVRLQLS